jgi:hypothetical protein
LRTKQVLFHFLHIRPVVDFGNAIRKTNCGQSPLPKFTTGFSVKDSRVSLKTKEPPEAVLSRLRALALTAYPLLEIGCSFGL